MPTYLANLAHAGARRLNWQSDRQCCWQHCPLGLIVLDSQGGPSRVCWPLAVVFMNQISQAEQLDTLILDLLQTSQLSSGKQALCATSQMKAMQWKCLLHRMSRSADPV